MSEAQVEGLSGELAEETTGEASCGCPIWHRLLKGSLYAVALTLAVSVAAMAMFPQLALKATFIPEADRAEMPTLDRPCHCPQKDKVNSSGEKQDPAGEQSQLAATVPTAEQASAEAAAGGAIK